ncbi:MAG: hypothetical protein QJR12_17125 [Mycobacterium sp.]|nr:hypothetical protein [Mycobacterium sp.]
MSQIVVQPRHREARFVAEPQIRLVRAGVELHGEAVQSLGRRVASTEGGTRPTMFCGTIQVYRAALPSSNPSCPKSEVGPLDPDYARNIPSALRGLTYPVNGLN